MKRIKGVSSRLLMITTLLVMTLSTLLPNFVYAEEKAETANETSASMIKFFQEERTGLNVDKITKDEVLVYGVFMSNFYLPWRMQVQDIVKDDQLPKRISSKFFGSDSKIKDVKEVNKKVHEAITKTLKGNKIKDFMMYDKKSGTKEMTGEDFLEKISGRGDSKIYGENNKIYADVQDPAFKSAIKVLFGYNPNYMLSKDYGLRKVTGMYIDGFGNIWGSHKGATVEEYVLIMPAAMNPATFTKGSEFKFPASNVFAMGASATFGGADALNTEGNLTPYYAVGGKFGNSGVNKKATAIVGITSPVGYVGDSNKLINGVSTPLPYKEISKFVGANEKTKIKNANTKLLVGVVPSNIGDLSKHFKSYGGTEKEKGKLVDYLMSTEAMKLTNVSDAMYYFNTDNVKNSSDSSSGSFQNNKDLIRGSTLYTGSKKPIESGQDFTIYANSSFASPMAKVLDSLQGKSKAQQTAIIKKQLVSSNSQKKTEQIENLRVFLTTGRFEKATGSMIASTFKILKEPKNKNVFGMINAEQTTANQSIKHGFWSTTFMDKKFPYGYGLTSKDSKTTSMNIASTDSSWFNNIFNAENFVPFTGATKDLMKETSRGGEIDPASLAGQQQINGLANYFHTMLTYRVFTINNTVASALSSETFGTKIKTVWKDKDYKQYTPIMDGVNNYPGMYWGYMVDLLNVKGVEKGESIEFSTSDFVGEHLPPMKINVSSAKTDLNAINGEGVTESDDKTILEMTEDIVTKAYSLMSTEPSTYRDQLIKASQDSWIIQTHRDITASWANNDYSVSTGSEGAYATAVGYINTPNLNEIPVTQWVIEEYFWIYISMALIVFIVTILMIIIGIKTIREGVLIVLLGMFLMLLPQFLVNGSISLVNNVTDKMYSEKFNFWAITQHQQSVKKLKDAQTSEDNIDYIIASNMEKSKNMYTNDVGVRVKWMSPKKDDAFDRMFNRNKSMDGVSKDLTVFRWLFSSYLNQEEYNYDNPLSTYVYRPYNSIASEASQNYSQLSGKAIDIGSVMGNINEANNEGLQTPKYRYTKAQEDYKTKVQFTKAELKDINAVRATTSEASDGVKYSYRYWALNNQEMTSSIFRNNYTESPGFLGTDSEEANYKAFSNVTESPFYYFYNALKTNYAKNGTTFKNALLDSKTFTVDEVEVGNNKINGRTRDFLDMEGLFSVVIPYLTQGNEYVEGWRAINGDGVDMYDFTKGKAPDPNENPELYEKYEKEKKKKEELKNVWKMYTPWVDQLYDLGMMTVKTTSGNNKIVVDDALNPGSYDLAGRAMVFSPADMYAKGYNVSDMTDAEYRIQQVLEDTKKDMYYLTNYYDFDEETLITASAMMATFNFNKHFSQPKILGNSVELYPKGFELKNFNYDAFTRMMLVNATGEPLTTEKEGDDLYVRIIKKTSLIVGLTLIVADVLGVYVIPFTKYLIVILFFFTALFSVVATILSPPDKLLSKLWNTVAKPIVVFVIGTLAFALGISFLMGDGLTGYVGGRTITTGMTDPFSVLATAVVFDILYIILLIWVLRKLLEALKFNVLSAFTTAMSVAKGAVNGAVATAKGIATGSKAGYHGGMAGYKGAKAGINTAERAGKGAYGLGSKAKDKLSSRFGAPETISSPTPQTMPPQAPTALPKGAVPQYGKTQPQGIPDLSGSMPTKPKEQSNTSKAVTDAMNNGRSKLDNKQVSKRGVMGNDGRIRQMTVTPTKVKTEKELEIKKLRKEHMDMKGRETLRKNKEEYVKKVNSEEYKDKKKKEENRVMEANAKKREASKKTNNRAKNYASQQLEYKPQKRERNEALYSLKRTKR